MLRRLSLFLSRNYEWRLRFLSFFLRFFSFFAASFSADSLLASRFARQSLMYAYTCFTKQKANITAASAFSLTCTCCTNENRRGNIDTAAEYALLRKERGAETRVSEAIVELKCCAAMVIGSQGWIRIISKI
jgi:hypothetical protein